MAFCDFVVKFDPSKDSNRDLTLRILYSVIIKRMKAHKPVVIFVGGDSGEGKSTYAVSLEEMLLKLQGLDLKDFINDINVYTPRQYPEKLDNLLFKKELKKVNIICMHEAREIVRAKLWYDFLTRSIADINAMSRAIKRLCIIIISQFIRDIAPDIRYTLTYYMIVRRPKNKPARVYINVLWKDDRDLEKPKLRKRKLSGYIVSPDGSYKRYVPQYLEIKQPSRDLVAIMEKQDYDAKAGIIKNKINKLIKEIDADLGQESNKINAMVDWYLGHSENLTLIGKQSKGKLKINPEFRKMHDLTDLEARDFENKLNEKLKEKGIIELEQYSEV